MRVASGHGSLSGAETGRCALAQKDRQLGGVFPRWTQDIEQTWTLCDFLETMFGFPTTFYLSTGEGATVDSLTSE